MALEIERRFLVRRRLLPPLGRGRRYRQGYLAMEPEVRLRLVDDDTAYLTVKSGGGLTREEYEYAVPVEDARAMLRHTPWSVIEKTRYRLPLEGLVWEVDCYEGDNAGLWSAEVELPAPDTPLALPPWLADEVTEERRFNNVNLAHLPLAAWSDCTRILAIVDS